MALGPSLKPHLKKDTKNPLQLLLVARDFLYMEVIGRLKEVNGRLKEDNGRLKEVNGRLKEDNGRLKEDNGS
ncbi:MAG: hypothetical protein EGR08_04155 [Prevotella sp.]|nr:hypothetical protein [Prevotella sp.]